MERDGTADEWADGSVDEWHESNAARETASPTVCRRSYTVGIASPQTGEQSRTMGARSESELNLITSYDSSLGAAEVDAVSPTTSMVHPSRGRPKTSIYVCSVLAILVVALIAFLSSGWLVRAPTEPASVSSSPSPTPVPSSTTLKSSTGMQHGHGENPTATVHADKIVAGEVAALSDQRQPDDDEMRDRVDDDMIVERVTEILSSYFPDDDALPERVQASVAAHGLTAQRLSGAKSEPQAEEVDDDILDSMIAERLTAQLADQFPDDDMLAERVRASIAAHGLAAQRASEAKAA